MRAHRSLSRLLTGKSKECEELAAVIQDARESGIDPSDERLLQAQQMLAHRYSEVQEIAAVAKRLGIDAFEENEGEDEDEGYEMSPAAQEALGNVHRLTQELRSCVASLHEVEASSTPEIANHPAYRKMLSEVHSQLEALQARLDDARAIYEYEMSHAAEGTASRRALMGPADDDAQQAVEADEEGAQVDLGPILQAAVNKLWSRPHECRIFTLQLLKSLAELDDRSLSMMCSCFSRYLSEHAVEVP